MRTEAQKPDGRPFWERVTFCWPVAIVRLGPTSFMATSIHGSAQKDGLLPCARNWARRHQPLLDIADTLTSLCFCVMIPPFTKTSISTKVGKGPFVAVIIWVHTALSFTGWKAMGTPFTAIILATMLATGARD